MDEACITARLAVAGEQVQWASADGQTRQRCKAFGRRMRRRAGRAWHLAECQHVSLTTSRQHRLVVGDNIASSG